MRKFLRFNKLNNSVKPNRGFTLIEILVVLTVVGVLSGLMFTTTVAIQRRSRDERRLADLSSLKAALQRYHVDQGFYPADHQVNSSPGLNLSALKGNQFNSNIGNPEPEANPEVYLQSLPSDPLSNQDYCYVAFSSFYQKTETLFNTRTCDNSSVGENNQICTYYLLYARLEDSDASLEDAIIPAGYSGTHPCAGKKFNYKLGPEEKGKGTP